MTLGSRTTAALTLDLALVLAAAMLLPGCTTVAPSFAHVHVGHAVTAFDEAPGQEGLFVLAERRAQSAASSAQSALLARNSAETRHAIVAADEFSNNGEYALALSLTEAAKHIGYAADMIDASANIQTLGKGFVEHVNSVIRRCELIGIYAKDAQSSSEEDLLLIAREIHRLAQANVEGEDLDGDGAPGSTPEEYGVAQLRRDLDAMIRAENPPYATVDKFYLFNLVRLEDGRWIFRTGAQGGPKGY